MKFAVSIASYLGIAAMMMASSNTNAIEVQTSPVFEMQDHFLGGIGDDMGSATLTRTDEGVGLFVNTKNLPSGVYTIWWFIVNDPSKCANAAGYPGACDWADVTNATITSLLGGSGDVVAFENNDNTGSFQGVSWIPVDQDVDDDDSQVLPGGVRGALTEPYTAEIHIDLLYHGLPLELGNGTSIESLEGQLRYTKGGCGYYNEFGGMNPPTSESGGCPSLQSAIFQATQPVVTDNGNTEVQTSNVFEMLDPFNGGIGDFVGSATITRTTEGVGLYVETENLPPGTYTIWWFIVNDVSKCKNEAGYPGHCDWADITNANVSSILGGSGDVVPHDSNGEYRAVSWIPVGDTVGEDGAHLLPGGVRGNLTNPMGAEIHIDILYHGLPLPLGDGTSIESLEGQLRFTKGGCGYYKDAGGMEPPPNDAGACPSLQSAIFEPLEVEFLVSSTDEDVGSAGSTTSLGGTLFSMVYYSFVLFYIIF